MPCLSTEEGLCLREASKMQRWRRHQAVERVLNIEGPLCCRLVCSALNLIRDTPWVEVKCRRRHRTTCWVPAALGFCGG